MIRNEKAQALIEFVLLLPIILLLFLGMIDLGQIAIRKSELENIVTEKVTIWQNSNTNLKELEKLLTDNNRKVKISKNSSTSFLTIEVEEEVSWLTPIISNVFKDYTINIKRVIPNE